MISTRQTILLFFIIILEGYIVLSTELLAIRQTIPYVGSGTDTISVIISAVLMPLAAGYQYGGKYKPRALFGKTITIRKKLILNICIASLFLLIGLSYVFMSSFFTWLSLLEIHSRVVRITIFCVCFLVTPVYLLGQTVPLISNYFSKQDLPKVTGKILFLSTLGSFAGATFSTLVLMATLGVHHTLTLNFILLACIVILLSKKIGSVPVYLTVIVSLMAMMFNSDMMMKIIFPAMRVNNQYNLIQAGSTLSGVRELTINGNNSSRYNDEGRKHEYIEFAEEVALLPILNSAPPKEILIIGSGGFTFGHNDKNNHYTYVDIDKSLKDIAEKYILKEPIGENKSFVAEPARAFLNSTDKKYDVIYLDAYLGKASVPEHLITREFFTHVKSHMKESSVLVANFIASPNFTTAFSRNLDNTLRSVFPYVSRTVIYDMFNTWSDDINNMTNIAYIYRKHKNETPGHVYTDNKNTVFYDKAPR